MGKLWDKGYTLSPTVESFITGKDYVYDTLLVPADCIASIAHVHTLLKASNTNHALLNENEAQFLFDGLVEIYSLSHKGKFTIDAAMEDCHTAIEHYLIKRESNATTPQAIGEKIHNGRSRNDQVQATLRLYYKEYIFILREDVANLIQQLHSKAIEHKMLAMPGRTHLQKAMPSSLGHWFASHAEQLLDDLQLLDNAFTLINRSPLGSAAGYGSPLPLDRDYTAKLLGFSHAQNNTIAVQNSRGRIELALVFALQQIALTLSRLAEDVLIFSLPEFGYFTLPDSLCSGSSIMPQKKNPDILELLRSKVGFFTGAMSNISVLMSKLPSGYQRDVQDTKIITFQSLYYCQRMLEASLELVKNIIIHKDNIEAACSPEIYATDRVYELVQNGMTFRSAYKQVAQELENNSKQKSTKINHEQYIRNRSLRGSAGNPHFEYISDTLSTVQKTHQAQRTEFFHAISSLLSSASEKIQRTNQESSIIPKKIISSIIP